MALKFNNYRLDGQTDTAGTTLVDRIVKIEDFQGVFRVLEWGTGDIPKGAAGQEGDFLAQQGASFGVEIWLDGWGGEANIKFAQYGRKGVKLPPVRDASLSNPDGRQTLFIKLKAKPDAYVTIVTYRSDEVEFFNNE